MVAISQLLPLLANGYEDKCIELGVIQRQRAFKTPSDLMLLCLYHLVNGCTLKEISEAGRLLKIGEFSDVAFMKKFGQCAEWFRWITSELMRGVAAKYKKPAYLENYRPVAVDASDVVEKGRSGRLYHLHYALDIFTLSTVSYSITKQATGETLRNFSFSPGDLVLGDRAYGSINGITHCKQQGVDFILRLRTNCFSVYNESGTKVDLADQFLTLDHEESADFAGFVKDEKGMLTPLRFCAFRKSIEACAETQKKLKRTASRKRVTVSEKAELFNQFVVVVTSLPAAISAADVLETYRLRWQIECYFKRLKSILDFGELPKKRDTSSLSWLNGKIMVALMIEMLLAQLSFSP